MLAWLDRNSFFVLGAAGFLLLAGMFVRDVVGEGQPAALVVREGGGARDAVVRVHIDGAVVAPGVYEVPGDARMADAIAAAGGELPGANVDDLNLARFVRDGERIDVGETGRPAAFSPGVTGRLVDLNSATHAQLMALSGIGEAYAQRIVDSRIVDGPFRSVDELRTRNLLPASTFDKVRDLLTISQ